MVVRQLSPRPANHKRTSSFRMRKSRSLASCLLMRNISSVRWSGGGGSGVRGIHPTFQRTSTDVPSAAKSIEVGIRVSPNSPGRTQSAKQAMTVGWQAVSHQTQSRFDTPSVHDQRDTRAAKIAHVNCNNPRRSRTKNFPFLSAVEPTIVPEYL